MKSICDILIASIYERDENDLGLAEVEVALIKPKRKNKTKQNKFQQEKKRAVAVSRLLPLLSAK